MFSLVTDVIAVLIAHLCVSPNMFIFPALIIDLSLSEEAKRRSISFTVRSLYPAASSALPLTGDVTSVWPSPFWIISILVFRDSKTALPVSAETTPYSNLSILMEEDT